MKKFLTAFAVIFITFSITVPAMAQDADNEENGARLEKIERDLNMLQRQVSRAPSGNGAARTGGGATGADFELRLSAIEEQMRELVGKTEENDFKVKKLTENLDKIQRDTDFRFSELSKSQPLASNQPATKDNTAKNDKSATLATASTTKAGSLKDTAGKSIGKTVDTADDTVNLAATDADAKNSSPAKTESDFASPRDHYNYAFRLLNQTQYDKASASFEDFTQKYPKDPLVGNAFYWLGETFYIRRDYVNAANSFRQGFEALPSGSKAPDNLLKLAMALNALKRDKESCVVLGQIITKFKKTADTVAKKAEMEQKRIACE